MTFTVTENTAARNKLLDFNICCLTRASIRKGNAKIVVRVCEDFVVCYARDKVYKFCLQNTRQNITYLQYSLEIPN